MKLRKTLRIARWEVGRNAGQLDRRTVAAILALLLLVGALTPMVASRGVTLDDGIYRVGVAESSPYYDPVAQDPAFVAVEPTEQRFESASFDAFLCPEEPRISGCPPGRFAHADSRKGRAAMAELRTSVEQYNDRLMGAERDQAAAFPVNVSLRYVEQNDSLAPSGSGASGGGAGDGGQFTTRTTRSGEERLGDGGTTGGSGDDGDSTSSDGSTTAPDGNSGQGAAAPPPGGSGGGIFGGDTSAGGTPGDISPPFPFESLVLAFAFVLPMNFVIQAYASSILEERINSRGELLLVSPVSRWDIVAGKTLPYLSGMVAIASATAVGIVVLAPVPADGPVGVATTAATAVAAVVPIALLFLASAFVGGMFARSFKELTFVTVSLSVFLTAYAFIPAIFTDVHPIAAISPLTLVVQALRGTGVALGDYAFSTLPLFLTAGVLFALGVGVYREEDMFTQRPVPLKALDALDSQISGRWSVAKLTALSIPFVFVAELLVVALLFALPVGVSIPVLLVAIAGIEEVAKSAPIYAGFAHSRFDRTFSAAVVLGVLGGLGFFVGEKATAIAQLVGLPNLELGQAAFGSVTGLGVETSPLVLVGLLLAPLALHATTTTVSALGATRNRRWYAVALVVATGIHAAYNLTVVSFLG